MLKLKRFDQGIWYDFPSDSSVKFKIRAMTPKKLVDIKEKSKRGKIAVLKPGGLTEIVDEFDDAALNSEIFAWMLEEVKGIEFEGNPSLEEIKDIIFNHAQFRDFITNKSYDLFRLESDRVEGELKNLESSQSGSQKSDRQSSGVRNAVKSTPS